MSFQAFHLMTGVAGSAAAAPASVSSATSSSGFVNLVYEVVNNMFLELCFLAFFLLGFGLLRLDKLSKRRKQGVPSSPFALKLKVIRSEYHAGNSTATVDAWRKLAEANFRECCTLDVLRVVMQCALEQGDYQQIVGEIGRYLASFPDPFGAMNHTYDE